MVHYAVPFLFSFSFSSNRGPEVSRKILGDKPQMNHDAEYDCRHSDACFVKGFVLRGREVQ